MADVEITEAGDGLRLTITDMSRTQVGFVTEALDGYSRFLRADESEAKGLLPNSRLKAGAVAALRGQIEQALREVG